MASTITLKIIFFGLIALAVTLEVVGDIFFKKWSIESKTKVVWFVKTINSLV